MRRIRHDLNRLRRIVRKFDELTKAGKNSHHLLNLSRSEYCFLVRDVTEKGHGKGVSTSDKKYALRQMRCALKLAADHLVDHINLANPKDVSINVVEGPDLQSMSEWTGVPKSVIEYLLCGNVQTAKVHTISMMSEYKDNSMQQIAICVRKPIQGLKWKSRMRNSRGERSPYKK